MKRGVLVASIFVILIAASVFAESSEISNSISQEVSDYVKSFVDKEGIKKEDIKDITPVDINNLPENIEIKKIEANNIGIYEVNYTDTTENNSEQKQIFVVTYSTNKFKESVNAITKNIQVLTFGYPQKSSSSDYLYTAAGVKSSENLGYVMLHKGSITGISTSLEISDGAGKLNIKVYKNGEDTGFSNAISPNDNKKIDYDTQSEEIVTYEPGDIISVYVENTGDVKWSNAVVNVETTS